MKRYKKLSVVLALFACMFIGMAATRPAEDKPKRNLKVLPKDISDDDLDHVMDEWKAALGVKCSFCHAASADSSTKKHLDFASDAKPEKKIARDMYKMTAKINKKYFSFDKDKQGTAVTPSVTCMTCHRGTPHPEAK